MISSKLPRLMAVMFCLAWMGVAQAQIPNDTSENAKVVEVELPETFNTANATDDTSPVFGTVQGGGWYVFTAPHAGSYRFSFASSTCYGAGQLSLGSADSYPTYSNAFCDIPWRQTLNLAAGDTWYALIGAYPGYPSSDVTFGVEEVIPPDNDTVSGAIPFSAVPYTDESDNLNANTENEFLPCGNFAYSSVWYAFTAPRSGRFIASVVGLPGYPILGVATGAPGALTQVACGTNSYDFTRVTFEATAGTTYFIEIGNYYGNQAEFTFSLEAAFDLTAFSLTDGAVNTRTGVPTVTGTVTCTKAGDVSINGSLRQKIDRKNFANASFSTNVKCAASGVTPWTAVAYSLDRPFNSGTVSVAANANGSFCSPAPYSFCEFDSMAVAADVRLKQAR